MSKFNGIIKCLHCGQTYRGKKERGKQAYICSGYHNYGAAHCPRNIVREDRLEELILNHIKIRKQFDDREARSRRWPEDFMEYVKTIEARKGLLVITYTDSTFTRIEPHWQHY